MPNPEDALEQLREEGLQEGVSVNDIRAGECEITTLTASTVILTTGGEQPLDAGNAAQLLKAYQDGSIQLDEDEA